MRAEGTCAREVRRFGNSSRSELPILQPAEGCRARTSSCFHLVAPWEEVDGSVAPHADDKKEKIKDDSRASASSAGGRKAAN